MIKLYCDGGLSLDGAKGFKPTENSVGAWAFIILKVDGKKEEILLEKSGAEVGTTNNKMEITSAIEVLEAFNKLNISDKEIEVFSDSMYLIRGVTQWSVGWKRNNWRTQKDEPVKNKELWLHLLELDEKIKPKWIWVRGHSGDKYNEKCDVECQCQMRKKKQELDAKKK